MKGAELVTVTAKFLDLWDNDTESVLENKKVTSKDILTALDNRYREHAFMALLPKITSKFSKTVWVNNYEWTGTVSASSTGTTLVVTSTNPVFDASLIGAKIYNSDLEETATIEAYIDGTSVTVDTTIGDTWDGDTVYLFTGRILFQRGTSLENALQVAAMWIKYEDSATTVMRRATESDEENMHEDYFPDTTQYIESDPKFFTSEFVLSNDREMQGIQFYPLPETPITNAIKLKVTMYPAMLNDGTEPFFPKGTHMFLAYGAAADLSPQSEGNPEMISFWTAEYEKGLEKVKRYYTISPTKRRRVFYRNRNLKRLRYRNY